MASPQPKVATFVQHWNERKGWAQANNIPISAFAQAVRYDYNRMTNPQGFTNPMSDTEAFDVLLSLKAGQNPFRTPADTAPSVFHNPFNAIRSDVQGIVTGLFHAPTQLWHDAYQAAHGNWGPAVQLIPGYTDVTSLFSPKGRQFLAQHPVSDMLDFGGIGKIADIGATSLRQMGAVAAADTLDRIPDHPLSRSLNAGFTKAADNIKTIASLRDYGTTVLGKMGKLKSQQDNILRPNSAAIAQMRVAPFPDAVDKVGASFANPTPGTPIFEHLGSLLSSMTEEEQNIARNYVISGTISSAREIELPSNLSDLKSVPFHDFMADPNISEKTKTLTQAYIDGTTSLHLAQWLVRKNIQQYTNAFTGEPGFDTVDGAWSKFERRYNQRISAVQKNQGNFALTVSNIYTGMHALNDETTPLPTPLATSPNESASLSTLLRRATDYFHTRRPTTLTTPTRRFNERMDNLFAEDGLLTDIINQIPSFRSFQYAGPILDNINAALTSLRTLRLPHDDPVYDALTTALTTARDSINKISDAQQSLPGIERETSASIRRAQTYAKLYHQKWNMLTQGQFAYLAQRRLFQIIDQHIASHYDLVNKNYLFERKERDGTLVPIDAATVEAGLRAIHARNFSDPAVQALIPNSQWRKFEASAWSDVSSFKAAGLNPYFVTSVSESQKGRVRPTLGPTSHFTHLQSEHSKRALLGDSIYDPRYGIPAEAMAIYRQDLINHIINEFHSEISYTDQQMATMARNEISAIHPEEAAAASDSELVRNYARKNRYVEWDPYNPYGVSRKFGTPGLRNANRVWIKDYNKDLIDGAIKSTDTELNKLWDKGMEVFRFSVLAASPRFGAHIIVGTGVMTALRLQHPFLSPTRFSRQAWSMSRNANDLPYFYSRGVSEQGLQGELVKNPFAIYHTFLGRKLGKLYIAAREDNLARTSKAIFAPFDHYRSFLEHFANFYRTIAYLEGRDRSLRDPSLITDEDVFEARRWNTTPEDYHGAKNARKVAADMQVKSPMERSIMRFVMPFWGWNAHVIRYLVTYPADHPLRASLIATLANQAIGEDSHLPDYLFRLTFLGQPNAAGDQAVLDTRQWNPFRDVANYMTWGGFVSALNPVADAALQSAFNVNTVSGSPDLFPELTYDSFYGTATANPQGGSFPIDLLKNTVPQIDTLLQVASKTSAMREAARSTPSKLPYLIADSLGVPWVPYKINIGQIQIRRTLDEYQMAKSAVDQAMASNSMAPLSNYSGFLPFQGYEVDKQYIANMIAQADAYNTSTGNSYPASTLFALPYASGVAPTFLTGAPPAG